MSEGLRNRRRIGFFGGSFDPPHVAHQMACLMALSVGEVEEVWLVPCYQHAFGKPLAPFEHRLEMCRLAATPFSGKVKVSAIEREIGGPSRTALTLELLQRDHPDVAWVLVIGADILAEADRWYRWQRVIEIATPFVISRSGATGGSGPALPAVSSTEIRRQLAAKESVTHLVPRAVLAYLQDHGLYQDQET